MKEKLPLTKRVLLEDVIPNLDYSSRIGIKTFTQPLKSTPFIKQILNLNITNKEEIIQAVNSLGTPNGGTPITAAIKASVTTLKEYAAFNKKIILVTDGEETGGGDYVAEAKKANVEGVNCQIHIIGIGLKDKGKIQAKEISDITNGSVSFIPYVSGTTYNSSIVKSNLSNFYSTVKVSSTVAAPSVVSQITQPEIKLPTVKEESPKEEIEKLQEEKLPNTDNNEALQFIIEEIKSIKEQLKDLKSNKTTIPDITEDAELNERIRKASEEYIFEILKRKYPDRVKWLNENGESNLDHDFEILDIENGTIEYYIECKGTVKNKPTFYMTKNEWRLFLNHTKNYQIYFVKNSFGNPSHIFIDNLLDWLLKGKLVPYLKERDVIKEERVFLTLNETTFKD
ncbi:MAG: DUF3883 domain-containing protein [Bacteroidales bacterium]|nr:DUF3883 domain-containing protein [Bacteroidales bacterium]MCL2133086.1 DUF3883 domain-containing protein [Bacteroidales bacterium]